MITKIKKFISKYTNFLPANSMKLEVNSKSKSTGSVFRFMSVNHQTNEKYITGLYKPISNIVSLKNNTKDVSK